MLFIIACLALASLLAATGHAHAEPISIALLGLIGIKAAAGSIIVSLTAMLLTTALQIGVSLLRKALQQETPRGVEMQVQVGDDHPVAFVVGDFATAGKRIYVGTWGRIGKTPNAYLVDVLQLGDLPAPGQPRIWYGGSECTILWNETPTEQGYPVQEYRKNGTDYMWVRYLDGTQTTTDAYLLSKFGTQPSNPWQSSNQDRPWQSDMIGRGQPILIVTLRSNQEVFKGGYSGMLVQPPPLRLYDPRKDSTAGGVGTHRWTNPATWEPTRNNFVIIYNLVRGIYYDDGAGYREWIYGGQDLAPFRLPVAAWFAAMNACDLPVPIADAPGGGTGLTEPQFRCGYEVRGDMVPLTVVKELSKSASGQIAEVGGIFKPLVGIPGSAVYAFSDGDILVTKGQSFQPFPRLEETHNAIESTYPEPQEGWNNKEAPALTDATFEAEDGGRRLPIGMNFPAVPYGTQVQRLQRTMLRDERRFRQHSFYLPPEAWLLEPLDVLAWTSARNGYVAKLFLVIEIVGERSKVQQVLLKEIDPSDYDWNVAFEKPIPIGPVGPILPPPQVTVDFDAQPDAILSATGEPRRPSIRVFYRGGLEDVTHLRVEVRRATAGEAEATIDIPYQAPEDTLYSLLLHTVELLPATAYFVRGTYVARTARVVEPSDWVAVTTPNVRLTDEDVYLPGQREEFEEYVREQLDWLNNPDSPLLPIIERIDDRVATERDARLSSTGDLAQWSRDLRETVARQALRTSDLIVASARERVVLRQEATATANGLRAFALDQITLAVGPGSALAERFSLLEAEVDADRINLQGAIESVQTVLLDAIGDESTARQALRIQLVGHYTGNDVTQLTEGLLFQDRQAWISETQALAQAIDLISAGVGVLFDWLKQWSWDDDVLGWSGNGTPVATGGWLRPANHATNPFVVSPTGLAVNGGLYKQIKVYIRKTGSPTWEGVFFWRNPGDAPGWVGGKSITVAEPTYDGQGQAVLTVNMTWTGTIDQIRIDLSSVQDAGNYFELNWTYIGRPSPGASQAQLAAIQSALASADLAEATARETLSTVLVGQPDPDGLTLETLSGGLLFNERQARSTADSAMASLIQGVQAEMQNIGDDLDAMGAAQSAMLVQLNAQGDEIDILGQSVIDIGLELDEKASIGITDDLRAQIEEMGGGETIRMLAEAVRQLRQTVNRQAVQAGDLFIGSRRAQNQLADIVADVRQSLTNRIDITDGQVSVVGQLVNQINLSLSGYATLGITNALLGRIVETENSITLLAQDLTAFELELEDKASIDITNLLAGRIEETEDGIEALTEWRLDMTAEVGRFSASGMFRAEQVATEAGALSTVGISAAASDGAATSQAAMFLSALTGGKSRIAMLADFFGIADGPEGARRYPFIFEDGVLRTHELRVEWAHILNAVIGWAEIEEAVIGNLSVADLDVENLVVRRINIEQGSGADQAYGSATNIGNIVPPNPPDFVTVPNNGTWTTIVSLTLNNRSGHPPLIFLSGYQTISAGGSGTANMRLVRSDDLTFDFMGNLPDLSPGGYRSVAGGFADVAPQTGPATYLLQARQNITNTTHNFRVKAVATVNQL